MSQMKQMPGEELFMSQFAQMKRASKSSLAEQDARAMWSRVARIPTKVELLARRKQAEVIFFTFKENKVWSFDLSDEGWNEEVKIRIGSGSAVR